MDVRVCVLFVILAFSEVLRSSGAAGEAAAAAAADTADENNNNQLRDKSADDGGGAGGASYQSVYNMDFMKGIYSPIALSPCVRKIQTHET